MDYIELELHQYDHGVSTWAIGPFRSSEKAKRLCARLERRLASNSSKRALDERYGEDEYNVQIVVRYMRTPAQAFEELLTGE